MADKGKKKQEAKCKDFLTNEDEAVNFIDDAFKLDVYQYVRKYQSLFSHQPLEFVKYLFSTYEWILANVKKPLEVSNKLESLLKEPLDNEYKYLLEKLVELLEKKTPEQFVNELVSGKNKQIEEITKIIKAKSSEVNKKHEIWYLNEIFIGAVENTIKSDIPIFEKLAFVREKQREYNLYTKIDKYYFDCLLNFSIDNMLALDEEMLVLDEEILRRESEADKDILGQLTVEKKKTPTHPPSRRKQIIDAAVRLTEKSYEWNKTDLVGELPFKESTLSRAMSFFSLTMPLIRDEAQAKIRETEK